MGPVVRKDEFAVGSILRMKLTNFLTYAHVELFPGPNLNVVVGPNGTGKSSIVCAICLGLGGNPSVLGRSTDVKDFVKHGESTAVIEIELLGENRKPKVIVYKIRRSGPNEFFVDQQKRTKQQVVELMRRYRIQVDNLCQFLAQDRVVEFSRITMQHLLKSTEKAVSSKLLEQHDELVEKQAVGTDYKGKLENLEKEKGRLDSEMSDLEPRYRAYHEYQARQEKIKHLEQKMAWLEYEDERKQFEAAKKQLEEKKKELENKKQEQKPALKGLEQAKTKVEKQHQRMGKIKEELNHLGRNADQYSEKVDRAEEELRKIHENLASSMEQQKHHQNRVDGLEDTVRSLEQSIRESEAQPDVSPLLREKEGKYLEVKDKIEIIQKSASEVYEIRNKLNRRLDGIQNETKRLKDVQACRVNTLRQMNENAYRLWIWYLKHKEEFQKPIYIPLLTMNLSNPADAKYFENVVADRDLQIFICGTNEDNSKLVRQMKTQNMYANATVVSSDSRVDRYQLNARMKQVGFRCFLVDMMEAPQEVIQFLSNVNHINRIPIGTKDTESKMETVQKVLVQEKMFLALTENKRISIKQSKYTGDSSVSDMPMREGKWLRSNVGTNDEQELLREQKEVESQLARSEAEADSMGEELASLKCTVEKLRSEIEALKKQRQRPAVLRNQHRQTLKQLNLLKSQVFNYEKEESEAHRYMEILVDKKIEAMEQISTVLDKIEDKVGMKIEACLEKVELVAKVDDWQKKIREADSSVRMLQDELMEREEMVRNKKVQLKHLRKTVSQLCALPENLQPETEEEKQKQSELFEILRSLPKFMSDVEKAISEEKGRLDVGGRVDDQVVKDYEEKKEKICVLEKDLERVRLKVNNWDKEIGDLKNSWLGDLDVLVQKISKNFSQFFRLLGCAGEIVVDRAGQEDDFANYGIGINVKFRDNEPMRRLTHQHQSGGERSVATMLYMLALQELSEVPFRCVDEINQGMDPVNERRVFEMVVNLLSGSANSRDGSKMNLGQTQYFMLTPKLLPNLSFSRKMTVLIVHNGSGMLDGRKWNIGQFMARKRAVGYQTDTSCSG